MLRSNVMNTVPSSLWPVVFTLTMPALGRDLDSRLAHFLERRSYVKALAFLVDGETAEA